MDTRCPPAAPEIRLPPRYLERWSRTMRGQGRKRNPQLRATNFASPPRLRTRGPGGLIVSVVLLLTSPTLPASARQTGTDTVRAIAHAVADSTNIGDFLDLLNFGTSAFIGRLLLHSPAAMKSTIATRR